MSDIHNLRGTILNIITITMVSLFTQVQSRAAESSSDTAQSYHAINSDSLSSEDILSSTKRTLQEIVALKNGVVKVYPNNQITGFTGREQFNSPELNIRGGRPSSSSILLNGANISSRYSGIFSSYVSPHLIQSMVLRKGNISAQYGNLLGSVIDISTPSGTSQYSGTIETLTDNAVGSGFDQNFYTATLSGPIPKFKNGTFFALVERRYLGDRNPSAITEESLPTGDKRLPNNWQSGWSYHFNSNLPLSSSLNLNAFADISNEEWQEYWHSYYFNSEHTPYYKDENKLLGAQLNYKIDDKTSSSISLSKFESYRFRGDGKYRENIFAYGRPNGYPRNDETFLFRSWDDPSTPTIDSSFLVDGIIRTFVVGGDESGLWNDYMKYKTSYYSIDTKIERNMSEEWSLISGAYYKKHTVRSYHHYIPTLSYLGETNNGFRDANRYGYDVYGNESDPENFENETKHPKEYSFFVESIFNATDIVITAGIRYEIFDYKSLMFKNPKLPLDPDSLGFDGDATNDGQIASLEESDLIERESFSYLSPRLHVSYFAGEKTVLKFSYGIFRKMANFSDLYVGFDNMAYKLLTSGSYFTLGNSNLDILKSKNLEVGLLSQLGPATHLQISSYYRKYENQVEVQSIPSFPTSYALYKSLGESNSQGIDFSISFTPEPQLGFEIEYSFSESKGNSSYRYTTGNIAWVNGTAPKVEYFLSYDQRHSIVGTANYSPASRSHLKLLFNYSTGLRYTPIAIENEATESMIFPNLKDTVNSRLLPNTVNFDLKAEQGFTFGQTNLTAVLWVKNVLDRKNVTNVWQGSGLPNTTAWLKTSQGQNFVNLFSTPDRSGLNGEEKYRIKERHPLNYSPPRQVFFGLRLGF